MTDKAVKPLPRLPQRDAYLCVNDGGARAIEFYKEAFGATEITRLEAPAGS